MIEPCSLPHILKVQMPLPSVSPIYVSCHLFYPLHCFGPRRYTSKCTSNSYLWQICILVVENSKQVRYRTWQMLWTKLRKLWENLTAGRDKIHIEDFLRGLTLTWGWKEAQEGLGAQLICSKRHGKSWWEMEMLPCAVIGWTVSSQCSPMVKLWVPFWSFRNKGCRRHLGLD